MSTKKLPLIFKIISMGIDQIRMLKLMGSQPKQKLRTPIPKKSAKKIQQEKNYNSDDSQWEWFVERRKDMKGICAHCGGKTCKDDDEKFHYSIAHILPKAYFPSVSKHPLNFIELCFWKDNCHAQMDNKMLDLIDMNCFSTIVDRFVAMYPMIDKNERRRIPQILLNYIEVEK